MEYYDGIIYKYVGDCVIVGEIGEERREIGYLGDTINTAQRVQSACKAEGVTTLFSEAFLARVGQAGPGSADPTQGMREHPEVTLPGKSETLRLFSPPP